MPVALHIVVTNGTNSEVFDKTYETAEEVQDSLLCLLNQYYLAGWEAVTLDPVDRVVILRSPDGERIFYASATGSRLGD